MRRATSNVNPQIVNGNLSSQMRDCIRRIADAAHWNYKTLQRICDLYVVSESVQFSRLLFQGGTE